MILALIKRDFNIAKRSQGQWIQPWLFFMLMCFVMPMLASEEFERQPLLSVGLLWLGLLLSSLLTLDANLRTDFQEGVFDQWLLSPIPFWWLILIKGWAHWVFWILPMVMFAPLLGLFLIIHLI
jgi:heme exporter protein B